jgi:hypothetical protein
VAFLANGVPGPLADVSPDPRDAFSLITTMPFGRLFGAFASRVAAGLRPARTAIRYRLIRPSCIR